LPETLSKAEAATRAGKTTKTIANWIRAGHVKAGRDDAGRQVVDLASLDAYLARQGKTPAQLPDGAKGLPELVSLLEKTLARAEMREREIRELEHRQGLLLAENRMLKAQNIKLLEAGPETPSPQETPGETVSEAEGRRPWWRKLRDKLPRRAP
jgi:hypothetical protein